MGGVEVKHLANLSLLVSSIDIFENLDMWVWDLDINGIFMF